MDQEKLLELLTSITEDIHEKVAASDLSKEEGAERLKLTIQRLLRRFGVSVDELVPPLIVSEYFGGFDEARKMLVDEAVDVATGLAIGAGGIVAQEFREPVYMDALEQIMNETFLDLKAATRTAGESALETIDKVKDDISKGIIQGNDRKKMTAAVMKTFRDDGLTAFITKPDKNGVTRKLPLDFYAKTVVRYKTREAANTGAIKRYEAAGQDLVKIYENSDTCEICGRFRNMVVSLRGETPGYPVVGQNGIKIGPYHPGCRGSVRPFVAKRKTPEELAEAKERNKKYHPEKDTRTPAQKKAYDKEQEKRRAANAEKIQFMNFNAVLGADNYKTLGAFRTGKRENSPKFQALQSEYRSARLTKTKPDNKKEE